MFIHRKSTLTREQEEAASSVRICPAVDQIIPFRDNEVQRHRIIKIALERLRFNLRSERVNRYVFQYSLFHTEMSKHLVTGRVSPDATEWYWAVV